MLRRRKFLLGDTVFKFAHIADCHIGAFNDQILRELSLNAFKKTMDICVQEKVNFVLITGDLFHSNIPDLLLANEAVKIMKKVKDKGIPIYVIYGSHDYSINETSLIDLLESAGLIKKIVKGKTNENQLDLDFLIDPKTKAKLTGLSGRKRSLEKEYFKILNRELLEKEAGFKIFAFHIVIDEIKPGNIAPMEAVPISYFPSNFDYYAGGHLHKNIIEELPNYKNIVYPGTIFAGYPRDLEDSANGLKRGFCIVKFDKKVEEIIFHEIELCDYLYKEFDLTNKNSLQAQLELTEELDKLNVENKIVLIKIKGELSGGKPSDISSVEIKKILQKNGAKLVNINRYSLTSKEFTTIKVMGDDIQTIENKLLMENLGTIKVTNSVLKGKQGLQLAEELLKILKQEQKSNERNDDYNRRVLDQAQKLLKIEEEGK